MLQFLLLKFIGETFDFINSTRDFVLELSDSFIVFEIILAGMFSQIEGAGQMGWQVVFLLFDNLLQQNILLLERVFRAFKGFVPFTTNQGE